MLLTKESQVLKVVLCAASGLFFNSQPIGFYGRIGKCTECVPLGNGTCLTSLICSNEHSDLTLLLLMIIFFTKCIFFKY